MSKNIELRHSLTRIAGWGILLLVVVLSIFSVQGSLQGHSSGRTRANREGH